MNTPEQFQAALAMAEARIAALQKSLGEILAHSLKLEQALQRIAEGNVMAERRPNGWQHIETVMAYQQIAAKALQGGLR